LLGHAVFKDSEQFAFAHHEKFVTIELDVLAGILPKKDEVACLDVERDALPVILRLPVAGCDDLALLWLFLRGIRDDVPPVFCSPSSMRETMRRSCSGLTFMLDTPCKVT
jgi:hypothetical protein